MTDSIHATCPATYRVDGKIESICGRSKGHADPDRNLNHPERRQHFDPDSERTWNEGEGE